MFGWWSYLVIPLCLQPEDRQRLLCSREWFAWTHRLSASEKLSLVDDQCFFLPAWRNVSMNSALTAEASNRWSHGGPWPDLVDAGGKVLASVEWADLIWLPETSLLILKVVGTRRMTPAETISCGIAAAKWHSAHLNDQLPRWIRDGHPTSLRGWVSQQLLGLHTSSAMDRAEGDIHWFGSNVPVINVCQAPDGWPADEIINEMTVDLGIGLTGVPPGFGPDTTTRETIINHRLQEWQNWRLHEWQNRVTVFLTGPPAFGQPGNLESYYLLLFGAVIYQRVRLTRFLDRAAVETANLRRLRQEFAEFRRRLLPHRITTYPLGDRIYAWLREANQLPSIQAEIEDEIRAADELERLELGRQENAVVVALTILAAIYLPITVVTGYFGMNPAEGFEVQGGFWPMLVTAYAGGGIVLAAFVWLLWGKGLLRRAMDRVQNVRAGDHS